MQSNKTILKTCLVILCLLSVRSVGLPQSNRANFFMEIPNNRIKNMTGMVFSRLTVTSYAYQKNKIAYWNCLCECGKTCVVNGSFLRGGGTRSCGCIFKEHLSTLSAPRIHGESETNKTRTKEYIAWTSIQGRCTNPNNKDYPRYGGRGISVCDRWLNSYENFLADMGRKPTPQHSIDRKDNDGNYDPSNCRWATLEEQGNNKRNNTFLTFEGMTLTIAEWARKINIPQNTLHARLRRNLPLEKALKTKL